MTLGQSPSSKKLKNNTRLIAILKAQGCSKVSLHIILMGVMETIYRSHTDIPLSKLGLKYCKAKKLTKDLKTHTLNILQQNLSKPRGS